MEFGNRPLFLCAALCSFRALRSTAQAEQHQAQQLGVSVASDGSWEELAPDPLVKLAVKHVSKMGGNLMINLLNEMTTEFPKDPGRKFFPKYFEEFPSDHNQFFKMRENYFVIAGVRNPCDWYVSEWAFAAKYDNQTMMDKFGRDFFGDVRDPAKFYDWMRWVWAMNRKESIQEWLSYHRGTHPGALTIRFWETFVGGRSDYIPPDVSVHEMYDTTLLDDYSRTYVGRRDVLRAISAFDPLEKVDCWVRHENLREELRRCLTIYEQISASKLDWEPFEKPFKMRGEPIERGSCESYYTPELAEAVRKLDEGVFDVFKYPTCCGPATGPMLTRGAL